MNRCMCRKKSLRSQRKPLIIVICDREIFVHPYSLFESFTINITFITENKANKDIYEKRILLTCLFL